MAIYMVERDLPMPSAERLRTAHAAIVQAAKRMAARGQYVTHMQCVFVPEEARAVCLFEAETADLVQEVNEEADVPFVRILEVTDFIFFGENSLGPEKIAPGSASPSGHGKTTAKTSSERQGFPPKGGDAIDK